MPSPAESEVGSRPPALDEQSGRCSQEAAAKYLAHQLASYPEVDDMYFSSARVLAALVLKHHVETEQSDVYRNLRTHMGPLSVASICTGTAAFESCMQAATECLYDTFGMANQASDFTEAKFAAESVQLKRDYGMVCLPKECCMYKDATVLMDDEKRSCVVHERNCRLPSSIDAFGAGFSCTSYSLLNKDAGKNATAMEKAMRNKEDPEGKVASVNTFAACCDVLKTSSPAWALFENVTSIDREVDPETKTNLEHCLAQIEALGYSCESFVLDAAWYGLPQGRKRIYLVCFSLTRQDISVSAETFFGNIKKLLTKLYIKPPAVDKFLYDDSDDHVIGYLNHLKAERAQKMTKEAEAPEKNVSWVSMHMTLAAKRDISWPLKIPEPIKTSPWFGVLTDRAKEVVGFAEDERSRMGRPIQFADIYHSANRYGHGDDLVPIILPRTQCWSFSRQRLLLGSELLRLQGQVPAEGAWSQTHYTDLAGNAFAGNVISALIMAILSSLRFSTESEQEENSEIEQMVSALTARGQCEDEDLEPIPTP